MRSWKPGKILTLLAWAGLLTCLYSMADDPLSQWDFNVYTTAAHAFAAGGNPYARIHPHPGLQGDLIYQYPPLTLYLFLWTTTMSLATAKLVWLGAKLCAIAALGWIWRTEFERIDWSWPIALFVALGFNATLLRDLVAGNISTFEQLGIWSGFWLLVRRRPYAAAFVLAGVAQFKLLPAAFLVMIPLVMPRDGWKPFLAGCAAFAGLLALNQAVSPGLIHDYLGLFANANLRMDDRGIDNPSSLAMFRDMIDLTSYAPGLPYNRDSGTIVYIAYLTTLTLVMIRAGWTNRGRLRQIDPRLLIYIGCALFTVAAPRMKDYSYILMLIPALHVLRDLGQRGLPADYVLLGMGFMLIAQPQQTTVPGMTALVYMLQAYLPLLMSGVVLAYLVTALQRAPAPSAARA